MSETAEPRRPIGARSGVLTYGRVPRSRSAAFAGVARSSSHPPSSRGCCIRTTSRQGDDGVELDRQLLAGLERCGLAEPVRLRVGDSRTAERPDSPLDLLFVDGDHREAGVRADFERWAPLPGFGRHILFHDVVDVPDLVGTSAPGVARMTAEVRNGSERRTAPGLLAHVRRE